MATIDAPLIVSSRAEFADSFMLARYLETGGYVALRKALTMFPEDVAAEVERLMAMDYSIHFHVWTEIEFLELLLYCKKALNMPFTLESLQLNGIELLAILSKTPAP